MKDLGIYIHIPFCKSKCFYCDFCSEKLNNNNEDEQFVSKYIDAVCKEILLNSELLSEYNISSIYIGGGTPSLIDSKYIQKILDILNLFSNSSIETTIEINPGTCDVSKLEHYAKMGINRLSIGLQTINNNTLAKIGRNTSVEEFKRLYDDAVKLNFKDISVDLIIGLPDEDLNTFSKTLSYLVDLKNITHISAYSLEVHESTKLDFLIKNKFLTLPSDEIEREMKHLLDSTLEKEGYIRYEISNWAKEGFESKHNLKYWTLKNYLGFGASSASYIGSTRYTNTSSINEYVECINNETSCRSETEDLDKLDHIKEYIILHLRLKDGFNIDDFYNKFKTDIDGLYRLDIERLINQGLLVKEGKNIFLSEKGNDLANIVWEAFI